MIYKVGINGVAGRMGTEVASLIAQGYHLGSDYLELADAVARDNQVTSIEGVNVRTWAEGLREPVHVWIDFSRPAGTMDMLASIETPVVICTTGFTDAQRQVIVDYSQTHAVLLAANTSPGMSFVRKVLGNLPPKEWGFNAFLSESHHAEKKDAPSGSAKEMLRLMQSGGYSDVPVNVIRSGGIVGEHEVRLISETEEIQIVHRVFDRKVFARGAVLGAQRLLKTERPGLYTWDQLFDQRGDK
jgi:4-hydroxy-tetrahydrodipicolinate reductase